MSRVMVRCGGHANQTWGLHGISWATRPTTRHRPTSDLDLHFLYPSSFISVLYSLFPDQIKSGQTVFLCKWLPGSVSLTMK